MAENYISNGNLEDNNGTDATFWTRTVTGDGACVLMQSVSLDSFYFQLTTVPGGPAGTAEVKVVAGANPYVTSGDSLQLNVIIGAASTNIPVGFIEIKIDTGIDQRTVVSGIAEYYKPEDIIGQQVSILINLAPRKIKGIESQGMILMASNSKGELSFINASKTNFNNGSEIK